MEDGWLGRVPRRPSPHCSPRPPEERPVLLVIHSISLPSGEYGGDAVDRLFLGQLDYSQHPSFADLQDVRVSAHLFIRRTGQMCQYVSFENCAWHAGVSVWNGRENCNDFSIGIELEGTDSTSFEAEQYRVLAAVTRSLLAHYPIAEEAIVAHSEIASGRKNDPGTGFDWDGYRRLIGGGAAAK